MLKDKKILIIIPFFNEHANIGKVISTLPKFIDYVILIDDGSTDNSLQEAIDTIRKMNEVSIVVKKDKAVDMIKPHKTFFVVKHQEKRGKGAGIQTGYELAKKTDAFCIATMDGDGQMNPDELKDLCMPILNNTADYSKGNRLTHPDAFTIIPLVRYVGIIILSFLNKFTSGYYHINDAQTGYTVISKKMLSKIDVSNLYQEYGYPNDMLTRLNIHNARVVDIPITPIYPKDGNSKMNVLKVIPKISFLMLQLFIKRIYIKYILKRVH